MLQRCSSRERGFESRLVHNFWNVITMIIDNQSVDRFMYQDTLLLCECYKPRLYIVQDKWCAGIKDTRHVRQ